MQSDEDLLKRIQMRDGGAFDALFVRYGKAVRRRVLRIVRDNAEADDIQQEVFLRLWTRAEQYHGRGTVKGWLIRIATNLALNHLRSVRRARRQPLDTYARPDDVEQEARETDWMVDVSAFAPDISAERAERQELCRRLIASLPDAKREVLRMVHEEQMELQEVAEELGIPLGTVKSRLHYGMKRLMEAAGELGLDWENI